MFPNIDYQNLARRQGKEGALSLKVLVLASLATVGTLDVHYQDIVSQLDGAFGASFLLVLGHPYSLGCLPAFRLGHDTELGPEEVVQQGGLARGLGAEHRDEMVIEAGLGDLGLDQVVIEMGTGVPNVSVAGWYGCRRSSRQRAGLRGERSRREPTDLYCLSSSMTWTPCSYC